MVSLFAGLIFICSGMKSFGYNVLPLWRSFQTSKLASASLPSYQFIDCGNYQRLEKFGNVVVRRSCPSASFSPKCNSETWDSAHLSYEGVSGKQGQWKHISPISLDGWSVCINDVLKFNLSPLAMGQVGVFPEQQHQWRWIQKKLTDRINKMTLEDVNNDPTGYSSRSLHVLNAFAYSGGSSLAALSVPGVKVTHLDASKTANNLARTNRDLSGFIEKPIRFITDDCMTFLEKEIKRFSSTTAVQSINADGPKVVPASVARGSTSSWDEGDGYDGLIFDPPAFGRSGDGKQWKLSTDLPKLFEKIPKLLSADPVFVLVTCHDPEWTPEALAVSLCEAMKGYPGGRIDKGELKLASTEEYKGRGLTLGSYARWSSKSQLVVTGV